MIATSVKGRTFIEQHEGLRQRPYKADPSEVYWTVGWGHYGPDVKPGRTYTVTECRKLLAGDLAELVPALRKLFDGCKNVKQQEIDAMASFAFNLGTGVLTDTKLSTLARRFRTKEARSFTGRCRIYRDELQKWVKAGGKTLPGLVERRKDEKRLACRGKYA